MNRFVAQTRNDPNSVVKTGYDRQVRQICRGSMLELNRPLPVDNGRNICRDTRQTREMRKI
jgi:hypothetical protein